MIANIVRKTFCPAPTANFFYRLSSSAKVHEIGGDRGAKTTENALEHRDFFGVHKLFT
jgi:hypothetical protein